MVICPNPILLVCNNCNYKKKIIWNCFLLPNCPNCNSNNVKSENIIETTIHGKMEKHLSEKCYNGLCDNDSEPDSPYCRKCGELQAI